ncbi:hypothetical protein KUA02_06615 [Komagataeibacter pomaceti]|nr:hypothetical protein [Novacetimonas pomaceti]
MVLVLAGMLGAARAEDERFDANELAADAPHYFVLRATDARTARMTGDVRVSETSLDFTNGSRMDTQLVNTDLEDGLVYRVLDDENPPMPSGRPLCPAPLHPLYLVFDTTAPQDQSDTYHMTLYCGSRPLDFALVDPARRAAVLVYRRTTDTNWAHSSDEGGYVRGEVEAHCRLAHPSGVPGEQACIQREEDAYRQILQLRASPDALKRCGSYVTARATHAQGDDVSFSNILHCLGLRDSRAVFDYCATRITGQKRANDTTFWDAQPEQAKGISLCFNALAATQARN